MKIIRTYKIESEGDVCADTCNYYVGGDCGLFDESLESIRDNEANLVGHYRCDECLQGEDEYRVFTHATR